MSVRVVHASLASVTAAAAFALVAASVFALAGRSAYAVRLVLMLRRVAILAAGLAAVVGVVLLAGGRRPHQPLHFLYGFFAVAAVPLAASLASRNPRRGALYHLLVGLLLLGLCFRLASTG
ncbi:MAG: hypothetical protein M3010_08655 [Candidatus Dormibacteraeota bacterium]|nr:hypothetical protein [Candidatus Dormibacteraeota bacterium]